MEPSKPFRFVVIMILSQAISNSLARKYIKFDMHHKSISSAITNVHHFLGNIKIKEAKNIAIFIFGSQNAKKSNGSFHRLEINIEWKQNQ